MAQGLKNLNHVVFLKKNIFTLLSHSLLANITIAFFLFHSLFPASPAFSGNKLSLPHPGIRLPLSPVFNPIALRGIEIDPAKPFQFEFILDLGDAQESAAHVKEQSQTLMKYFLAALAIPEEDMWVNLSPYEKDRVIPDSFGATQMGRDLLAQDYLLKQLTSSMMYPEEELGEEFWEKVYQQAYQHYGTVNIPVNTFNKVWIVPEKAVVYEQEQRAFILESRLKVLLEEDYQALKRHQEAMAWTEDNMDSKNEELSRKMIREIILPVLEKEVNSHQHFAVLRQIYQSLILSIWFKDNLKENILSERYVNQKKVKGIEIADEIDREKIYARYLEAFQKGVYNYIKEDYNPHNGEIVERHYSSGGMIFGQVVRNSYQKVQKLSGTIQDRYNALMKGKNFARIISNVRWIIPPKKKEKSTASLKSWSTRAKKYIPLSVFAAGLLGASGDAGAYKEEVVSSFKDNQQHIAVQLTIDATDPLRLEDLVAKIAKKKGFSFPDNFSFSPFADILRKDNNLSLQESLSIGYSLDIKRMLDELRIQYYLTNGKIIHIDKTPINGEESTSYYIDIMDSSRIVAFRTNSFQGDPLIIYNLRAFVESAKNIEENAKYFPQYFNNLKQQGLFKRILDELRNTVIHEVGHDLTTPGLLKIPPPDYLISIIEKAQSPIKGGLNREFISYISEEIAAFLLQFYYGVPQSGFINFFSIYMGSGDLTDKYAIVARLLMLKILDHPEFGLKKWMIQHRIEAEESRLKRPLSQQEKDNIQAQTSLSHQEGSPWNRLLKMNKSSPFYHSDFNNSEEIVLFVDALEKIEPEFNAAVEAIKKANPQFTKPMFKAGWNPAWSNLEKLNYFFLDSYKIIEYLLYTQRSLDNPSPALLQQTNAIVDYILSPEAVEFNKIGDEASQGVIRSTNFQLLELLFPEHMKIVQERREKHADDLFKLYIDELFKKDREEVLRKVTKETWDQLLGPILGDIDQYQATLKKVSQKLPQEVKDFYQQEFEPSISSDPTVDSQPPAPSDQTTPGDQAMILNQEVMNSDYAMISQGKKDTFTKGGVDFTRSISDDFMVKKIGPGITPKSEIEQPISWDPMRPISGAILEIHAILPITNIWAELGVP